MIKPINPKPIIVTSPIKGPNKKLLMKAANKINLMVKYMPYFKKTKTTGTGQIKSAIILKKGTAITINVKTKIKIDTLIPVVILSFTISKKPLLARSSSTKTKEAKLPPLSTFDYYSLTKGNKAILLALLIVLVIIR